MISLGENYKHSGLIPLKSLGVLPFSSMGALPSPHNGRSHLSAGVDAVPFASAAALLADTWERGSRSRGASTGVPPSPWRQGAGAEAGDSDTGREGHRKGSPPALRSHPAPARAAPCLFSRCAQGTWQPHRRVPGRCTAFPPNSSRDWANFILNEERATGSGV